MTAAYPLVSIIIPTYNRPEIVRQTVALLWLNLRYAGEFEILVGNDGDPVDVPGAFVLNQPTGSLGANLDRLMGLASGDYLFQMDDDHHLVKPLDLTPHVNKLMTDQRAGWIRLMGIAGHDYRLHMDMTPFSQYLIVDWDSPELYITSNRPHLKKIDFHGAVGLYPIGLRLGETEEAFCYQAKNAMRLSPQYNVLIPLDVATESSWEHVGESWQGKGF